MSQSPLGLLALGFALGLRHALDVDHLVAVSAMVSERRGLAASWRLGALWGVGHTAALLAVAVGVIFLRAEIPPALAHGLELAVAAMLIAIGIDLLWKLARGATFHSHLHAHGPRLHSHPHVHARHAHGPQELRPPAPDAAARLAGDHDAHAVSRLRGRRSLLVGMLHGLAGSAALMLAVLTTVPTPALAIAYVATFGVGSIAGMMATSAVVALPLGLAARRLHGVERVLRGALGAASVGVGLAIAFGG